MSIIGKRWKAAQQKCSTMSNAELEAIVAAPERKVGKTVKAVAENILWRREHERRLEALQREQARLRRSSDDGQSLGCYCSGSDVRHAVRAFRL